MATLSGHRRIAGVIATLAAALVAAGPVLGVGVAYAASEPQVEFSGGSVLNMVVCKSQPTATTVTVPAETSVRFANRLGQTATLRINGKSVAQVGSNQAVPVLFHYGPVSVTMTVPCNVGVVEQFGSVVVNVTRPAAASSTTTAASSGSGTTTQGAAAQTSGRAALGRSTAASPAARPAGASPSATASPGASAAPSDAAIWGPGGLLDESRPPLAKDLNAGTNPALADGAAADVGAVVPASGTPRRTPSGMLALIATVLTIGVGVAAIRSMMAGRATRARFA
jgi:hypothetical protein